MSTILKQFDLTDPDNAPRMLERGNELDAQRKAQVAAIREAVAEEHMPLIFAAMNTGEDRGALVGARLTLVAFTKAGRREAFNAQVAWKQKEAAHYREAKARIRELEEEVRRLKAERYTPPPTPPAEPPTPVDWDYPEQKRRRVKRDEVITPSAFSVEVVARQVEETVKQFGGRCKKPDVSARLPPEARPYLPTAYKHLHASRRVRVSGWDLSTWN